MNLQDFGLIDEAHAELYSVQEGLESLSHVGVGWDHNPPGVGSSRYPHGSGENPNQHDDSLKAQVAKMRAKGLSNGEIAKALIGEHATADDLKSMLTIERIRARQANIARANELLKKTNGNVSEVARIMYGNASKESTVRSLLNETISNKDKRYENTAEYLKARIAKEASGVIDVSSQTEQYLGVTKDTKKVAIKMLEEEGYTYTYVKLPSGRHEMTVRVLAKPGMSWADIQKVKFEIGTVMDYSPDEGISFKAVKPPVAIDDKRVYIRYDDDPTGSGTAKDGTIELRRGVNDISLGGPTYAQVRIAVEGKDGKGYMKGMAFYSDSIPDGYDVVYNVNKKMGTALYPDANGGSSVFKSMKNDETNPFGALIKAGGQPTYIDSKGKEQQGVINKVSEEGDWDKWSKRLASQFLSKQNVPLIEQQLNLSILDKKAELESIRNLTNPVIKQKLLQDYADETDTNASTLKARGFKQSAFQVILPITTLKDNEIYAPNYKDGEQVALVRYPHGGTFEIPVLTVNNKNKLGISILGKNAKDAVGINQKVADRLSGADFDGDTALVIPMTTNKIKIQTSDPLPGMDNWDHKALYKLPDDAPPIKNSTKQKEMGIVTNLITDMTVADADRSEIARAVKHSMVVIDSEKHHLDYKKSAEDLNIKELIKKYQATDEKKGGASTILSRATSKVYVNERKEVTDVNKMTPEQQKAFAAGKKIFIDSGKTKAEAKEITDPSKMTEAELARYKEGKKVYRDTGERKIVQEKITQMALTDDATTLVRDKTNKREMLYANYANELKSLANQARKEARSMTFEKASPTAKETYAKEVESLNTKLRIAQANDPLERKAVALGSQIAKERMKDDSVVWDYEHKQRERQRSLEEARLIVGAKKEKVLITDNEWKAIQANAISPTKLRSIIQNTDQDAFKKMAMPKGDLKLSKSQISLIKQMAKTGKYSNAEIAQRLGVSTSTISKYANK